MEHSNPLIYDEFATKIRIEDEGGGEFLVVEQNQLDVQGKQSIRLEESEWIELKRAIDAMFSRIRTNDKAKKKIKNRKQQLPDNRLESDDEPEF